MANAIYPKFKQAAMGGGANVNLIAGDVKAILIDLADYTYAATHEFRTDIPGAAEVAVSGNMTTKAVTDGKFTCANFSWTSVTGDQSEAVIFFVDTGVAATSRLVAILDTGQTGLPITPNGGNINFTADPAGVFAL